MAYQDHFEFESQSRMHINSVEYPGHRYEIIDQIGRGGMGSVHYVLFRNMQTAKVEAIYAGKIVKSSYLNGKNGVKRTQNLEREIEILRMVDS